MNRLSQLKDMLAEQPDDPFLNFALAKEYEKREDWDRARVHYEHLRLHHKEYIGTYYHMAKLLESLGQNADALMCYNEGLAMADKLGDTHTKRELISAKQLLQATES